MSGDRIASKGSSARPQPEACDLVRLRPVGITVAPCAARACAQAARYTVAVIAELEGGLTEGGGAMPAAAKAAPGSFTTHPPLPNPVV